MTYINLFKITILLSILFIIPPIAYANINNEAIKMNKERILKEINANYTERNINHYIELDNDLEFISVFEEESKQAKDTVNQLQIVSILEKTLKKLDVRLKLKYEISFRDTFMNNSYSNNPTTEIYNIILTENGNQILEKKANIAITISQLQDIKQAYLQTQQRFIYFFDISYSSPSCHFRRIDNLGTYAVESTRKEGNFMWIYKNMMIQISRNSIPELSLKIANMFQEEVEHELKKLHE